MHTLLAWQPGREAGVTGVSAMVCMLLNNLHENCDGGKKRKVSNDFVIWPCLHEPEFNGLKLGNRTLYLSHDIVDYDSDT